MVLEAVAEVALFHHTEPFLVPFVVPPNLAQVLPPASLSVTDGSAAAPPFITVNMRMSLLVVDAGIATVKEVVGFPVGTAKALWVIANYTPFTLSRLCDLV